MSEIDRVIGTARKWNGIQLRAGVTPLDEAVHTASGWVQMGDRRVWVEWVSPTDFTWQLQSRDGLLAEAWEFEPENGRGTADEAIEGIRRALGLD